MIDAGAAVKEEVWESPNLNNIRARSAYAGACFSVVKILARGIPLFFIPERRGGMKIFDDYGSFETEDLFFDEKGLMLPASLTYVPFMLVAGEKNILLEPVTKEGGISTDDEGMAVMAVRSADAIHVIIAACYPEVETKSTNNLKFRGADSFTHGDFYMAVVDEYSEDFHYSETGKVTVMDGGFEFVRDIDNYSTQYVKFEMFK